MAAADFKRMREILLLAAFAMVTCAPAAVADSPACSDGLDNDFDGAADYPQDPDCTSPDDAFEAGPGAPACIDGLDNDADGRIDYPADAGCEAPDDDDEASCQVDDPAGCGGPGTCLGALPPLLLQVTWTAGGMLLTWQHNPLVPPPTAYLVYRIGEVLEVVEDLQDPLAAVPGTATSYLDATAVADQVYTYWLTAAEQACEGPMSTPATGRQGFPPDASDCVDPEIDLEAIPPVKDPGVSMGCIDLA